MQIDQDDLVREGDANEAVEVWSVVDGKLQCISSTPVVRDVRLRRVRPGRAWCTRTRRDLHAATRATELWSPEPMPYEAIARVAAQLDLDRCQLALHAERLRRRHLAVRASSRRTLCRPTIARRTTLRAARPIGTRTRTRATPTTTGDPDGDPEPARRRAAIGGAS